jgi:hypothetical protein
MWTIGFADRLCFPRFPSQFTSFQSLQAPLHQALENLAATAAKYPELEQEAVALRAEIEQRAATEAALRADIEQGAATEAALRADIEQRAVTEVALRAYIEQRAATEVALRADIEQRAATEVALRADIEQRAATEAALQADIEQRAATEAALRAEVEQRAAAETTLRNAVDHVKREAADWEARAEAVKADAATMRSELTKANRERNERAAAAEALRNDLSSVRSELAATQDVELVAAHRDHRHATPPRQASREPVTRAKPLFRGHRQPRLPSDLGFYDLRLAEAREAQANLARKYGLSAFCYYYYWFNGSRILERPLDEVLASGKPDYPFMICWANEPWTRNWDGENQHVLLSQTYEPGWATRFARDVARLLRDRRYFRLGNQPMLLIYRIAHIPEQGLAMREIRMTLRENGIPEVHLAAAWVRFTEDDELPTDPSIVGLDAYFEFPPHMVAAQPL